ncbi:hypothetical protein [Desulfovibrio piger]|uniref:hypothetical protein n=1 Tax=Desulfovibrio piger TaxID=901 RepID=UPI0026E93D5D|nr:hypothetical protein [Desulfovibrio piger]
MPEQAEKKWCPLARVSIQQREVGRINAVQTGAFNFVIQQMPDGGEMTFIPVTCLGARCALYRKSLFPWRSGMCAVAGQPGLLPSVLSVLSVAVVAAAVVFYVFRGL